MQTPQYQIMRDVEDIHFWYVGMRHITSSILSRLTLPTKMQILDAGCGTGANLNFLSPYGRVIGIDISPVALKYVHSRGYKTTRLGSITNIPFKNNSFDLITCFDVLGHKRVNDSKAISELYRVLKPGGYLIVRVAAHSWLFSQHDHLVQNVRRYSRRSLTLLLNSAGFSLQLLTFANMFLFPFIVIKRLFAMIIHPKQSSSDTYRVSRPLNSLLTFPLLLEAQMLKYINLPFGISLISVASKPTIDKRI